MTQRQIGALPTKEHEIRFTGKSCFGVADYKLTVEVSLDQKAVSALKNRLLIFINKDENLYELLKGGSASLIFQVTALITGFLSTLLIANYFGAETLGVFSLSIAVLNLIVLFSRLGLDTALVRLLATYNSQEQEDYSLETHRKAVNIVFIVSLLLTIMLFSLSPFVADFVFGNPALSTYFRIISLAIFPLSLLSINAASFRGFKQIKMYSYFKDVSARTFHLLLLAALTPFITITAIPLYTFLAGVILAAALSQLLWIKRSRMIAEKKTAPHIKVKEILKISLPMIVAGSMFFIMQWTDTILIGIFRTESEVGVYNVALKLATLASLSLFAINSIAAPKFAELYSAGKIEELGDFVRLSTKLIFWTSIPMLLIIAVLSPYLLGFFGLEFKLGLYALLFLLMGYFFNAISGSVGLLLQMTGKHNAFRNIIAVAAMINIILNVVLIPMYGITGAAFATTISILFWNLIAVIYVRYEYGFLSLYIPFLKR